MNAQPAMLDVVIVGAGTAGLSAALVLGRARRRTLVLDGGPPRNAPSPASHGFFTRDGAPPLELLRLGRQQLEPYDTVRVQRARALRVEHHAHGFAVTLDDGAVYTARRVLLATGVVDRLPAVAGMERLWGRGVYHCPFCHGWEVHDEPLALYGRGQAAIEFAGLLLGWSRDLLVCSDGPAELDEEQHAWLARHGIRVEEERILRLDGETGLERIVFEHGGVLQPKALFVRPRREPGSDLSRQLDCEHGDDDTVRVTEDGRTSVAGVYAAGDMTTAAHQVLLAAASGARAAIALQRDLGAEDFA